VTGYGKDVGAVEAVSLHWRLLLTRVPYYWRHRRWIGLARSVLWFVLGHCGEDCMECGSRYRLWWSPQPLWNELMPSTGGLLCLDCFDAKAKAKGILVHWSPIVVSRNKVPTTNHWSDPVRDRLLVGDLDPDSYERGPAPIWQTVGDALGWDLPSYYYDGAFPRSERICSEPSIVEQNAMGVRTGTPW